MGKRHSTRGRAISAWFVAGAIALVAQDGDAAPLPEGPADAPASLPVADTVSPTMGGTLTPRVWAGHQVALGSRKVPVLGKLETRTDTFVLAHLQRTEDGWRLVQEACDIRFLPVADVEISMDVDALPRSVTELTGEGGKLQAKSRVKWGSEDLDRDGHPGVTVEVDASICAGSLYVASDSRSSGYARFGTGFIGGHINTTIHQRILGANGMCLQAMADDSEEEVAGPIAYIAVDEDATCESLLAGGWPVDAMPND